MADIKTLVAQATARGSVTGFADTAEDIKLPPEIDRTKIKIFHPLRVGDLTLQHRVVHPALGRARSAYGAESPQAAKYFAQRTTPGSLIISQATGVSADSVAWQWAGSLDNDAQQAALSIVIQAVHAKGGYWFQQLFHVGRCTTPALVKLARERAGLSPPIYGYRPVSSSAVPELGLNTHSGENPGTPHSLTIEEIHHIRNNFKKAAQRAVKAGADGIEILAGNGWLIDQFLHDNINKRTDEYGGTVENRSRFGLEVVDAVAEVVGYQRVGIRISPFSYFHDTNGSQPLEQLLHFSHQAALRGIAYLHVGQSRFTRNLSVEQNVQRLVAKGIALEDISLRPFRRLLSTIRPTDPLSTQIVLIGNGGYTAVSGVLAVEEGLADAVSFARRFISNPDLVERLRLGYPLTPNNIATFYTHGAEGYTTYSAYSSKQESPNPKSVASDRASESTVSSSPIFTPSKRRVAVIGAGISGIASAAALERVGDFEVRIFERRRVPGGTWVYDPVSTSEPQFHAANSETINPSLLKPAASLPVTVPRATEQRFHTTPLYLNLQANIPYKIMGEGSVFELPASQAANSPFLSGAEISAAVAKKTHHFDHLIEYSTTVEDVEKLSGGSLRLTLRKKNPDDTDTWAKQEFDHLIVATGHNSVPRVPDIPGLDQWTRNLRHTVTWRSGEEFYDQKILIVGTGESAIDVCLQSLPYVKGPIYISQRTPHPQYPTVFSRPGIKILPTISHLTANTVHLTNGKVLSDIDTIVFATGYLYTYPFLSSKIRPPPVKGYRVPSLYQHIFDMHNPETIAFNGVVSESLSWLTWEKSAFLIALLWSGKIHLPPKEVQEEWESRRLTETGDRKFHVLAKISEQVLYFDELNELAAEYLYTDATDDVLLRSFPFKWVLEWLKSVELRARWYKTTDSVSRTGSVGAPAVVA